MRPDPEKRDYSATYYYTWYHFIFWGLLCFSSRVLVDLRYIENVNCCHPLHVLLVVYSYYCVSTFIYFQLLFIMNMIYYFLINELMQCCFIIWWFNYMSCNGLLINKCLLYCIVYRHKSIMYCVRSDSGSCYPKTALV